MTDLSGKYIWLVGASEGIGQALAWALVRKGANVALSARSADKLELLKAALPQGSHLAVPVDVTSMESVQHAWQALCDAWPQLDMVIYNAGVYDPLEATAFDLEKTQHMVDVNFLGALRVLAPCLPYFVQRGTGHIALVGSVAGYRGLPAAIGYGASKAALIHLAENLKADLARTAIRVQLINPGFVATRLTAKNSFRMPGLLSPDRAAEYIVRGLRSCRFEIHFPPAFSYAMKALSLLPYCLFFPLLRLLKL